MLMLEEDIPKGAFKTVPFFICVIKFDVDFREMSSLYSLFFFFTTKELTTKIFYFFDRPIIKKIQKLLGIFLDVNISFGLKIHNYGCELFP